MPVAVVTGSTKGVGRGLADVDDAPAVHHHQRAAADDRYTDADDLLNAGDHRFFAARHGAEPDEIGYGAAPAGGNKRLFHGTARRVGWRPLRKGGMSSAESSTGIGDR